MRSLFMAVLAAFFLVACGGSNESAGKSRFVDGGESVTPLFTSAPDSLVMAFGVEKTFEVGGGAGVYSFASTDEGVVTVLGTSSNQLTLTPVGVGSATVSVVDSKGARIDFAVVVGGIEALTLTSGPTVTLAAGGAAVEYQIRGGRTPYLAASTNESIVTVTPPGNGTALTMTPQGIGSANVVVTDASGTQAVVSVAVAAVGTTGLTVSPASAAANVGDELVFTVGGGVQPYGFSVNNTSVASFVSDSGSTGTFRMENAGATSITVTDAAGQVKEVALTVTQSVTQLRVSPATLYLQETYELGALNNVRNVVLDVFGGTAPYRAYTTDQTRTSVQMDNVDDSRVRIFAGTQSRMCSNTDVDKYTVASSGPLDPTIPESTFFDIVITVIDAKGAAATAKLVVVDDNQDLNPSTTCR